jgi:thiosulfate/3-mercaptopyruvate sulfurtransferase
LFVSDEHKTKKTGGLMMKLVGTFTIFSALIALVCFSAISGSAQHLENVSSGKPTSAASRVLTTQSSAVDGPQLVQPEDLVNTLKSAKSSKPLIIQVGFRVLYLQAHVPGSEYTGPASSAEGIRQFRKRVEALPRTQSIVLYCGCCPWDKCPNVNPAYKELRAMGFTNVRVLYIADNFGKDWVDKGYPVAKGE